MDPEAVFKRYDIRGMYPEEINQEFANKLGKAFGTFLYKEGENSAVITRDTKESSEILKDKFKKGLKEAGVNVFDAGTGPTDYTAISGVENNCFSVQITSSHLPLNFNGFKFMYPEGNGLMNDDLNKIKHIFRGEEFNSGNGLEKDISKSCSKKYRSEVKNYFNRFYKSINKTVVLETMGGASSVFLPDLLEELGAEVIDLSEDADGPIIDPPNPKPDQLHHLEKEVAEKNAEIGLAADMDGDRVAVYYNGDWLNGNQIFSVLTKIIDPNNLVASIDTSKQVEEVAKTINADINYTRVGDPFVISETLNHHAELSGEPNGHYCFTELVPYNSGTLAALLLAAADLSILDDLPERINERSSIKVEDKEKKTREIIEKIRENYNLISTVDGVKFRVEDTEVLIRPSGSSPKLRIIVDGSDIKSVEEALEISKNLIQNT